jgi:hypothetical protein
MTKLNADRMTYEEAIEITNRLPNSNNLLPVGSVASKQPFPRDLDFLTMMNLDEILEGFMKKYPEIWLKTRIGKKRLDYYPIINNKRIVINIWKVNKENLPFFYFAYGYPRGFIIAIRKKAKSMGYKLNQYGIFKDGQKLNINTLEEIFNFFNLPFRTPQEEYLKHAPKYVLNEIVGGIGEEELPEILKELEREVEVPISKSKKKSKVLEKFNPEFTSALESILQGQQPKYRPKEEQIPEAPPLIGIPEAPPLIGRPIERRSFEHIPFSLKDFEDDIKTARNICTMIKKEPIKREKKEGEQKKKKPSTLDILNEIEKENKKILEIDEQILEILKGEPIRREKKEPIQKKIKKQPIKRIIPIIPKEEKGKPAEEVFESLISFKPIKGKRK